MHFSKFFSSVLLAVLYASTAASSPLAPGAKFATHHVREISPDLKIETYHPPSSYKTFGEGVDHPLHKRDDATLEDAAAAFVESELGVKADEVTVKSTAETEGAKHAYIRQRVNGVPFANAVANVAFNDEDKVVAFGSSFVKPNKVASKTPTLKAEDAIAIAENKLGGKFDSAAFPAPSLEYLARQDGSAALTYVLQVRNVENHIWYEAFVDAHSGDVVSVTDFKAHATYRVIPLNHQDLTDGGFVTLEDPHDKKASPHGWHYLDGKTTKTTSGNNAIAYIGDIKNVTTQSGPGQKFIFKHNEKAAPTTQVNMDAARTNAFFVVNSVHDISYRYGFTEKTFNFQDTNFESRRTKGNDRVEISVQDPTGTDNAYMTTPPDGQPGFMQMYIFDLTNPYRDGSLQNDIVIHENTHGITNRMTGGGSARCLQSMESAGLGEGWSDAFAEWNQITKDFHDFTTGKWVLDYPGGVRTYPYSTSQATNPFLYSDVPWQWDVHSVGEIWANMLHNVHAFLVSKHGWSKTAKTDPNSKGGNVVFLHLFIDALALQPCNPTFIDARDAWIQADVIRYRGANKCTLWLAFSSRGLGLNATSDYNNDYTMPASCRK